MVRRQKVLFIGGYGRSGSTLLDRLLGQTDGFFSAGEVRHLWQEGLVENRRCGCGVPFSECEVWREVLAHAFPDGVDRDAVGRLKVRVDRAFRIPQIVAGAPAGFRRDRDAYLALLSRLYDAIGAVTGAHVIVDSSKDVSQGWLLTRADVDLAVVHLVRDSRAVAYSWRQRTYNPGNGREMRRHSGFRSALEWNAINGLTSALRRTGAPFELVRYDDLVVDPEGTVGRIIDLAGEKSRPALAGTRLVLGTHHTVAGNPNRFQTGPVTIRPDDRWREVSAPSDRAVVTALTLPVLRRYGFM